MCRKLRACLIVGAATYFGAVQTGQDPWDAATLAAVDCAAAAAVA